MAIINGGSGQKLLLIDRLINCSDVNGLNEAVVNHSLWLHPFRRLLLKRIAKQLNESQSLYVAKQSRGERGESAPAPFLCRVDDKVWNGWRK